MRIESQLKSYIGRVWQRSAVWAWSIENTVLQGERSDVVASDSTSKTDVIARD